MSGRGEFLDCQTLRSTRKRRPREWSAERNALSGRVSRRLLPLICADRGESSIVVHGGLPVAKPALRVALAKKALLEGGGPAKGQRLLARHG
jgi:hypothetical protein